MAPTLEDVAKEAGCSSATVSRVLNNSCQVSDQLRQAILKAVETTRYQPRKTEPQLMHAKAGGTRLVRVIVFSNSPMEQLSIRDRQLEIQRVDNYPPADILSESKRLSNSFYRSIVDGMVDELVHWDCQAVLTPNRGLLEPGFLATLRQQPALGLLLTGESCSEIEEFLAAIEQPVVVVDQNVCSSTSPVVTIDNATGIRDAFQHLFGLGHRRIAFLTGPADNFAYRERETAYRYQMAEHRLQVQEEWIYRGLNRIETSAAWLAEQFARPDRPTALLCSNDIIALGAIRAADLAGLRIPDDISVVGFDDIEPAAAVTPPLTTVHAPTHEMGRLAVRQLMIASQTPTGPAVVRARLLVTPKLVVRASTAAPCAG